MDRALRMESIHKIIDTKKVRVPKTFLLFWALFMILGITEETTNLLRQYALTDVKEFYTPSFIGPRGVLLLKAPMGLLYRKIVNKSIYS